MQVSAPTVVGPSTLDALRELDTATIYNVLKGLGRAEPGSYTGPELRCLFPGLGTIVGYAVTSEWTGGESDAPNGDYVGHARGPRGDGAPSHRACSPTPVPGRSERDRR